MSALHDPAVKESLTVHSRYTAAYGRNVERILVQATHVVQGRIPREVRNELMAAVKAKVLGRLPKDGLKPEVFFHPDHLHGAIDRQKREAAYSVSCIAKVIASPADVRDGIERAGGDVLEYALNDLKARIAKATGTAE